MTGRKIFILDDDKAILGVLKEYFTDRQFDVDAANLMCDAKEKLATSRYSAAILDLGLSVIDQTDGLDLVTSAWDRYTSTRAIREVTWIHSGMNHAP